MKRRPYSGAPSSVNSEDRVAGYNLVPALVSGFFKRGSRR
jgi:hypothetical protein